ncbi:hydrolase, partial [Seonamhaeicola marinus]
MKQRIFIYLFIFSILLVLFQYVNSKRVFEDLTNRLDKKTERIGAFKDSLDVIQDMFLEVSHFNLDRNEDAISYFEDEGYNIDELIP